MSCSTGWASPRLLIPKAGAEVQAAYAAVNRSTLSQSSPSR